MLDCSLQAFKESIKSKKVAVLGIGISNTPLILYLARLGADVTAFDRADAGALSGRVGQFEGLNVKLCLGERYLDGLYGFDVIFKTPVVRPDIRELVAERERGAVVTSEMEVFLRLCPSKVFGVTGSDGKTTTASLIYEMLKASGYTCHLGGNIGTPLLPKIDEIRPEDMTVVELSSFQLQTIGKGVGVAVVTNVTPNHLDVHKSYGEYIAAKKNIFALQGENDVCVLNYDNGITRGMAAEAGGKLGFFSLRRDLSDARAFRGGAPDLDGLRTGEEPGESGKGCERPSEVGKSGEEPSESGKGCERPGESGNDSKGSGEGGECDGGGEQPCGVGTARASRFPAITACVKDGCVIVSTSTDYVAPTAPVSHAATAVTAATADPHCAVPPAPVAPATLAAPPASAAVTVAPAIHAATAVTVAPAPTATPAVTVAPLDPPGAAFVSAPVMRAGDIRIPGTHNVENCLAAICAVWPYATRSAIVRTAKRFGGVEHRIEHVRTLNGARYYNDSSSSGPTRTIACLKSFSEKVILIAGGKDKALDYSILGEHLARSVKLLILCGQTSEKIKASLLNYLESSNEACATPIIECGSLSEAVRSAWQNAAPGDTVVLSPASTSFDMFRNFEERGQTYKKLVSALPDAGPAPE
ncbi:MAG: hypothetical protein LBL83_04680 [Clostridiales bacterium]|nr:hypothetical protein [Clostridiales bacterium]